MADLQRRRGARAAVVAVALALLTACAGATSGHSLIGDPTPIGGSPATTAPPITTTIAPTTTATPTTAPPTTVGATTTIAAPSRPPRPYAVGWATLDLTDASRPTGSRAGRHLPTLVFYPTAGANPTSETQGAPGLYQSWPLVLFAEGYNTTPLTYHDLVHHLAEAGFVVVAPSFPLETAGGPLDENDLQNEPGDIKFVISAALNASDGSGLLKGMVDPTRIALTGHSDGAEAVLGAAYLPGVADTRVGPVVAMAAQGILNSDHLPPVHHQLLVVQGTQDTINPPARSDHLYAGAASPKAYLHLLGAGHLPPVADANQWRPVVEATVVDWLDAWFGGQYGASAAGRLGHDANLPGVSQIQLG